MSSAVERGDNTEFVIWINGGYGVGKSAVLDHVGDVLAIRRTPFSLMDVDWFHRSWPVATNDPANAVTEAANMAAVWSNYRQAGPRQLVVSGVLWPEKRKRYENALGSPIRSVRLEASVDATFSRLRSRYQSGRDLALQWHLERVEDVARRLQDADQDEAVLPTTNRSPLVIAADVLRHYGC